MHDAACLQAHHRLPDAGSGHAEERCQLVFAKSRTGPDLGRKDAGDDRRLDGFLRGLGCVAILHTRQKAKRMPKSCVQDFQDVANAVREICLPGMQIERNLCGRRRPKTLVSATAIFLICGRTAAPIVFVLLVETRGLEEFREPFGLRPHKHFLRVALLADDALVHENDAR